MQHDDSLSQSAWVRPYDPGLAAALIRVVVKIMVPFWVPIIIRHLLFRVPKKGP